MRSLPAKSGVKDLAYRLPLHPFFLAAFPILSLLAANIDEIYPREAIPFLGFSLVFSSFLLLVLRLLIKDWLRAGLLTSLLVLWFFHYGRLYVALDGVSAFGLTVGRHRYLLVAWSGLAIAGGAWLGKKLQAIRDATLLLNVFSGILLGMPLLQIGIFYGQGSMHAEPPAPGSVPSALSWTQDTPPPDIYYIVLDAYTRSDVLENEFAIDNTPFLDTLTRLGFSVSECAQSNYTRTLESLTSTFNMEYVQDLVPGIAEDFDRPALMPYLHHSAVRRELEGLGYQTVVFKNPWGKLLWEDAAVVFRSNGSALLSPFNALILRTTVLRAYLDIRQAELQQLADYTNYEDTQFALAQLPRVPQLPGPKFVFVHLVIPHPPFVFGPNGEKIALPYNADAGNVYTEEDYKRGYASAVAYIDKRMAEILPILIQQSEVPPIIVIAGDHGTPWGGRQNEVRILGAFYTPGVNSPMDSTITPVNIFRTLFNSYFQGEFELLPDKSYFVAATQYINLLDSVTACEDANRK